MNNDSILLHNLTFAFSSKQKPLFETINLELAPGTVTFITGRNGSGKSTFFRIIQGNIKHDEIISGAVTVDGKTHVIKHNRLPQALTDNVSFIAQDISLMLAQHMTVHEHLELARLPSKPGLSSFIKQIPHADHQLMFPLPLDAPVYHLSGGQKQLLALMMILQKPIRILLLDEPTAALDRKHATEVFQIVKDITKHYNLITLIITHDELNNHVHNGHILHLEQTAFGSTLVQL